ncbi:MAG: serine/threonine protein kinase [Glaciecola sp.]
MTLQNYLPPAEPVQMTTIYGAGSSGRGQVSIPEAKALDLDGVILSQGGVYIGPQQKPVKTYTTYGDGDGVGPSWQANFQDAGQIALVILMVWVGIRFLVALMKGVKVAFRFLGRVITFPFRVIGYVFRLIGMAFAAVASLFGMGRPVARKVTETAGAAYTKAAEGWNNQEANGWPALKKARGFMACERKQFAGMMGTARAKCKTTKDQFEAQKGHLKEQKQLLKKMGRRGYLSAVIAGGGSPAKEAADDVAGFTTSGGKVKPHTFPGYRVIREMPRGGSGAHLFLAQPKRDHKRELAERNIELPSQVVIKSFSLQSGAHMTGILREGRALDAAKQLGQVLEHSSGDDGMYYVMPFVPGDTLDLYISKLHKLANGSFPSPEELKAELTSKQLDQVLGLSLDLITELERFHDHGLWHKDIKPGNLIVNQDRLHIVDLGLLTPLASALTLTTHGTEYFRDPEMVRLAMSGAQVRDVDAVKFDLYSAGAVLFSMLEGTFPTHGNLSRLQRPCPPALAWVVRRAMSEHDSRYPSAKIMRRDLAFLCQAKNLGKVKPVDLPSWNQQPAQQAAQPKAMAALHPSPDKESEKPTAQPKRRSWSAVIPKKAAAVALVSIVLLAAVIENENLEARRLASNGVAAASSNLNQAWGGAPQALSARMAESSARLHTYSTFPSGVSTSQRAETIDLFVKELQEFLPADQLKAVYIHGATLNGATEALYGQLESRIGKDGVKVLKQDDGASLELSARAASLLDAMPASEYPSGEDSRQFFELQGEVQAIARFVETPRGLLAHWVVENAATEE